MATKRRTDHESTQKPDGPAVEAASADQPVSGGSQDDPGDEVVEEGEYEVVDEEAPTS